MTFVVVFVVGAVVAVHVTQQFGAQVEGNLRLRVVVLVVLGVDYIVVQHVGRVAGRHDGVALQAVHAVAQPDAQAEIRQHRGHRGVDVGGRQDSLKLFVEVLVIECVGVEAFGGRE